MVLCCSLSLGWQAQSKRADSLKLLVHSALPDTQYCKLNLKIALSLFKSMPDSSIIYFNLCNTQGQKSLGKYAKGEISRTTLLNVLGLSYETLGAVYEIKRKFDEAQKNYSLACLYREEVGDIKGLANTYNNMANIHAYSYDTAGAMRMYRKSREMRMKIKDEVGIAQCQANIASVYGAQGNVPAALAYYGITVRMLEGREHKQPLAFALTNMSHMYMMQRDFQKAMDLQLQALKLSRELGDSSQVGRNYFVIADISFYSGDPKKALAYYNHSLKIFEYTHNEVEMGSAYNGIAGVYYQEGKLGAAAELLNKAIELNKRSGDKAGMVSLMNNLSSLYMDQKKFNEALRVLDEAKTMALETGQPDVIMSIADGLFEAHKKVGNYASALENYELFIKMRDSIHNESNRKATIRSQLKYEYEKQAAADSVAHAKESEVKSAELSRQSAELKAKKNQQYALFGGLSLVMIFAVFMYNRFRITQKQKNIIESQKEEVEKQKKLVEVKQKEVIDSITYARRIQLAQIPSEKRVENMLMSLRGPK